MSRFMHGLFIGCALLSTGVVQAEGDKPECVLPPAYVGSAEFQKLKSLEGTWEMDDPMNPGQKSSVIYDVTSNGSAVVERMNPGTPHEMVSVYHDEKGKLAMTHYCAIGNQPRLALQSSSGDTLTMSLAKSSGINPKTDAHMHALEITFVSQDQVKQSWIGYDKGKRQPPAVFTLTRVKEAAHAS